MNEIREEIDKKRDICQHLIEFIEKEDANQEDFQSIIDFINLKKIREDKTELSQFIHMISKISKHHLPAPGFKDKIEKILFTLKADIKQTFSNYEIFHFFKSDKPILLYLIKDEILTVTQEIAHLLFCLHSNFFYPEIKPFLSNTDKSKIESEISRYSEDFENLRQKGENPSQICKIIRNDSIEEFVIYFNRFDISVSSQINPSIFETHLYLNKKEASLIEYAAFFGAIQIFNYLIEKEAKFDGGLWLYSINGRSNEIINKLEILNIEPKDKTYEECYAEAIKCYHNDIAEYIMNNFLSENSIQKLNEKTCRAIGKSDNYLFITFENFDYDYTTMCYNDKLVNIISEIKNRRNDDSDIWFTNEIAIIKPNIEFITRTMLYDYEKKIKRIKILTSVKSIYRKSFFYCEKLEKIKIPSSVKEIRSYAFYYCHKLKHVFISSGVSLIQNNAFSDCYSLELIQFESPCKLKEIQSYTFENCKSLKLIIIPSSVKTIRLNAFHKCSSLSQIVFESPSSLTTITRELFCKLQFLTQIKIPSSVKIIGNHAFSDCSNLSQVEFESPSKLKYIKKYAFWYSCSLVQIKIPSSVVKIDELAFCHCTALKEILFERPSSVCTFASESFEFCESLKKIDIPSSLEKIGPCAFRYCSSLEQVTFESPSFLDTIGNQSFENCGKLKKISIPSSVRMIGCFAFSECSSLIEADVPSSINEIHMSCFPYFTKIIKRDI